MADEFGDKGKNVTINPSLVFDYPRLRNTYIALQAWKEAILSDPQNLIENWVGSDVCHYIGVFCPPALDNYSIKTVEGIDLNHNDITGVGDCFGEQQVSLLCSNKFGL